jgi:hypothetical protein
MEVDWGAQRRMEALGISWESLNRCGDPLPVRVRVDGTFFRPSSPDGTVMLVQPVYAGPIPSIYDPVESPCLADMIAYNPRTPGNWYWRRGEYGLVLGDENLEHAEHFHESVRLYQTPFDWLKAGGDGVCPLDRRDNALERLRHVGGVIVDSVGLGREIERTMSKAVPRVPPISVILREPT